MSDIETRLRAVEDQLAIQRLAARFSDAVNERDVDAFAMLWAADKPVWQIGDPLPSHAEGKDAIVAMLRQLMVIERYFMQLTHAGIADISGDRATARWAVREHGRGDGTYYDNLAVYNDVLVREGGEWRFQKRSYSYRFLDQSPFHGDAFGPQS